MKRVGPGLEKDERSGLVVATDTSPYQALLATRRKRREDEALRAEVAALRADQAETKKMLERILEALAR
jgi:hypothetical protein